MPMNVTPDIDAEGPYDARVTLDAIIRGFNNYRWTKCAAARFDQVDYTNLVYLYKGGHMLYEEAYGKVLAEINRTIMQTRWNLPVR